MDFTELAQARYSVRTFSDKAVEPEVLKRILEAGLLAPTAKNNQPQRIRSPKNSKKSSDIYKQRCFSTT